MELDVVDPAVVVDDGVWIWSRVPSKGQNHIVVGKDDNTKYYKRRLC